jgi:hypothetical protein
MASIPGLKFNPTMRPGARSATSRVTAPVPHAISSARSPGLGATRSIRSAAQSGGNRRHEIALVKFGRATIKLPMLMV